MLLFCNCKSQEINPRVVKKTQNCLLIEENKADKDTRAAHFPKYGSKQQLNYLMSYYPKPISTSVSCVVIQ